MNEYNTIDYNTLTLDTKLTLKYKFITSFLNMSNFTHNEILYFLKVLTICE